MQLLEPCIMRKLLTDGSTVFDILLTANKGSMITPIARIACPDQDQAERLYKILRRTDIDLQIEID